MSRPIAPFLGVVFVCRLVLAPSAGADDTAPTPIRDTAARETGRLAPAAARGPMPAGLKWAGTGLPIGSGMPVFIARFSGAASRTGSAAATSAAACRRRRDGVRRAAAGRRTPGGVRRCRPSVDDGPSPSSGITF
jgi:hypothetical protein